MYGFFFVLLNNDCAENTTDINMLSNNYDNISNYSISEIKIGKFNGKDLYRKCYIETSYTTHTTQTIVNFYNPYWKNIVKIEAIMHYVLNNTYECTIIPIYLYSIWWVSVANINKNSFNLDMSSNWTSENGYKHKFIVIFEYTKN